MRFIEDGQIAGARLTRDGYLVANVCCARTGIQEYMGSEVGSDLEIVRVYRPESEVFSKDSLATFVGKPATDNHPAEPVSAVNWKQYAVGSIGNEVLRDGEYIRVPLTLMDAGIIQKVQDGKREISMGYEMALDFTPGTTPGGEPYDAVMTNLKMNHLAIVDRGRAGPKARVGDAWGASPITTDGKPTMTLKTIVVDGLSVETTDAGEKAIRKLQGELQAAKDAAAATQDSHIAAIGAKDSELEAKDAELAGKDAELAKKDKEIADLKAAQLDDAALDKRVAERSALLAKAGALAKDADFKGLSDSQIKAKAVDAVRGEGFTKDKSEAYIDAAFDLCEARDGGDPVRQALIDRENTQDDNGQAAYEKRLSDGWKGEVAK